MKTITKNKIKEASKEKNFLPLINDLLKHCKEIKRIKNYKILVSVKNYIIIKDYKIIAYSDNFVLINKLFNGLLKKG